MSGTPHETVWLLSCEGPEDERGQTDLDLTALIGVYSTRTGAQQAERRARRGSPTLQTYVDAYRIDEIHWMTEFTVE